MATLRQMAVYNAMQRRKRLQDKSDFAPLFASPEALGNVAAGATSATTFTMPANARLGVSLDALTDPGDISVDDGVNVVSGGGGAADVVQRLDVVPEGREVAIVRALGCPAGAATIYLLDEWNLPFAVATATFT